MVSTVKDKARRAGGKKRRWLGDSAVASISGALLWASFPDVGLWFLSFVALALVFSRLENATSGRALLIGTFFGAAFWLPHITWVLPATGGWLPWVALATTQIIAYALWAFFASRIRFLPFGKTLLGQVLGVASVWVGVEQLRSSWPWSGFPWGNLAYPQVDSPLVTFAPLGGEVLVSFTVVAVAVLLRRGFALAPQYHGVLVRLWACGAVVTVFVVASTMSLPKLPESGTLGVGVVQGNIELPGAATYSIEGKVTANHVSEHRQFGEQGSGLDLIIWGENSLDRDPRVNAVVREQVSATVDAVGVPTLVGLPEYRDDQRWNWIGMWYPHTGLSDVLYGKQIPVPFGEYIPWRGLVSALATEAAQISVDLVAVDNPAYLEARLNDGRVVPMSVGICFEVAYETLLAEGVRQGGQILVIPTNNYHFARTAEPAQQAQMLRFRAAAFSRAAIQASTTGESMLIRPDGSIQSVSGRMTAAHLQGILPLRTSMTPVTKYATYWHLGALVVGGIYAVSGLVFSLYGKRLRGAGGPRAAKRAAR
ncbi:apolipoprotein N-acyltransferase [Schaalia suimastitidis]|uniref:apolipoprotein N-acyltransferase n=1 Tax=Schaalia suimastitidis TaxID=121163 RepID=UPI00040B8D9C|nr:apolipoprotein N-acyltransferase [Schaalia suimastitidis]